MADDTPLPRSKPAFLRRVLIRGYKSIEFCNVTLEPLTVLVGRNASGKSNFLDALEFLRDLVDDSVTTAVGRRNGWGAIVYRQNGYSPAIEFEVDAEVTGGAGVQHFYYKLSLDLGDHRTPRVNREELDVRAGGGGEVVGFRRTHSEVTWVGRADIGVAPGIAGVERLSDGGVTYHSANSLNRPRPDRLLLSLVGLPPYDVFAEHLRLAHVYRPVPDFIRKLQPEVVNFGLIPSAANLARVLADLDEFDRLRANRVREYLAAVVPEVQGFCTVKYGDFETVRFQVKRSPGASTDFDAQAMSDGTLRALALLAAAWQVHTSTIVAASGFIGLEEPETALHPAATRALVDALDEATLHTQIILSTHSADLLDNPIITPDNVRVVRMVNGRTVIGRVDPASVEIVRRDLNTLGGLEREDQLRPDNDPEVVPTERIDLT